MREIKFRFWDSHRGKMIYLGNLVIFKSEDFEETNYKYASECQVGNIYGENGIGFHDDFLESRQPDKIDGILMQCTGLIDKNGNEIYEGDIVSFKSNSLINVLDGKKLKTFIGVVVFDEENLKYDVRCDDILVGISKSIDDGKFKIIGNVHKNPELMK